MVYNRGRELAGGALRYPPKPERSKKKMQYETDREVSPSVSSTPATKYVFIRRLVTSRHMTPAMV